MPSSVVKSYAKRAGVSVEKAEKAWEDAKKQADKKFKEKDEHYWSYVSITTQMKLGIRTKPKKRNKK
jgi:hypothetical protein